MSDTLATTVCEPGTGLRWIYRLGGEQVLQQSWLVYETHGLFNGHNDRINARYEWRDIPVERE